MFVRRAIDHYLKGKRSRRDVTRFLETHPDLDRLAERIADEIREGRYRDTRITYFNRIEPISGKHRVIGRETVRHQIYDHVAVMALQPLFDAKVGRWQTASIPNRGTIDARRAIKRWTRERSSKWFVKLDVRKYYPSIDRTTLKAMLTRDVGDPILLRLVFHLIDRYQGDNGLNIGSYLSQWLANYYLSRAYHWIESPAMTIERTSRRTGEITRRRLITHQLWYMDDLLLIGTSNETSRSPPAAPSATSKTGSNSTCTRNGTANVSTSNPSTWSATRSGPTGASTSAAACSSAPAAPSAAPDAGP